MHENHEWRETSEALAVYSLSGDTPGIPLIIDQRDFIS